MYIIAVDRAVATMMLAAPAPGVSSIGTTQQGKLQQLTCIIDAPVKLHFPATCLCCQVLSTVCISNVCKEPCMGLLLICLSSSMVNLASTDLLQLL